MHSCSVADCRNKTDHTWWAVEATVWNAPHHSLCPPEMGGLPMFMRETNLASAARAAVYEALECN